MGLVMGFCFSHPEADDQRTVSVQKKNPSSNLHSRITSYPAVIYFLRSTNLLHDPFMDQSLFFPKLSPQKITIAQSDTYFR